MKIDSAHPLRARIGELVTLAHWRATHARREPSTGDRPLFPALPESGLVLELNLERERRRTFVSTLAHELRQPLSTLSAALEVVGLGPDYGPIARAVAIMERQLRQMNRVVEDLLDETRWAQGKLALRKQRVDLGAIVREAAVDAAADAAERGHAFTVTVPPEPLYVDADPQRLHQVLSNLLRNAVKYTEPGGRISLVAERNAATIVVRVVDSGRGIAAASLPHIFDLFSQVRPSEGAGVGIGLGVAREVVLLHNGRIDARSAGLGHGSEFIVTLPAALSSAFLIEVLAPLAWTAPPSSAGVDDAGDLNRLEDDGGSPRCCDEQRPARRSAKVV